MPAEAGLNRSLPRAGWNCLNGLSELGPEFLAEIVRSAIAVIFLEHERVSRRLGRLRVLGLASQLCEHFRSIVARAQAAFVGRKVEMPEADAFGQRELVGVLRKPGFEFLGRRLAR